jgi:hypothetical protein
MREHVVVPTIRSGEIAHAARSGVRHREDALKVLDFSDGSVNVHAAQSGCTCDKHTRIRGRIVPCRMSSLLR